MDAFCKENETDVIKWVEDNSTPSGTFAEKELMEWAEENIDAILKGNAEAWCQENSDVGDVFTHSQIEEWALDNGFMYVGSAT